MNRTTKLLDSADATLRMAILTARGHMGARRQLINRIVETQRELDDCRAISTRLYPVRKPQTTKTR